MGTDLSTEIKTLQAKVRAASGPLMPPAAREALVQACHVIELLSAQVDHVRETLANHLHLRA